MEYGDGERAELQQRAREERRADAPVAGRQVAHGREQRRADQRRDDEHDAGHRIQRAHRDALRALVDVLRDQPLQCGTHRETEDVRDDHRVHHPARLRESVEQERQRLRCEADDDDPAFAEALEQRAEQRALHDRRDRADREQRDAVVPRGPAEPERRVQHPRRVQDELRQDRQRVDPHQSADAAQLHEALQCGERIGLREREAGATIGRQGFGQDEETVGHVDQRERGGDVERQADVLRAEEPADHRADDEADAERGTDQSIALPRVSGGVTSAIYALATEKLAAVAPPITRTASSQPSDGARAISRKSRPRPVMGEQHHRPATEAVRQRPEQGRARELHHAVDRGHHAVPVGLRVSSDGEFADQRRQHRDDEAEAEHVEQHADEDERNRCLPRRRAGAADTPFTRPGSSVLP